MTLVLRGGPETGHRERDVLRLIRGLRAGIRASLPAGQSRCVGEDFDDPARRARGQDVRHGDLLGEERAEAGRDADRRQRGGAAVENVLVGADPVAEQLGCDIAQHASEASLVAGRRRVTTY